MSLSSPQIKKTTPASEPFSKVRAALGRPSYEDEDVLLYSGDCLELMAKMPDGQCALTVTSPPYNIGKEYEGKLSTQQYVEWTEKWIRSVYRITQENGAFWLNLGYMPVDGIAKALPIPYLIWQSVPFFLIQEVVWNYGAGVAGRHFLSPRNEKLLWYVKSELDYTFNLDDIRDPNVKYPNQRKNGKLKVNPLGKNPSDVWQIPKVTSGRNRSSQERTPHPAQFPIDLVLRTILASSNTGELVLDPFAGSGTVLEAAILSGRKAVGFEIKPRYIEFATTRLQSLREAQAKAQSQSSLFDIANIS